MSDNLAHIPLPRNEWVDLYALSGITVGQPLVVENVGVCDIYVTVSETEPTKDHDAYNILKRDDDIRLTNTLGDLGAWAFCNTSEGLIGIAEREGFQPLLKSALHDGFGNPLGSFKGALDVHDADVHDVPINEDFHDHDAAVTSTLAVAVSAQDTSIELVDASTFTVEDSIQIEDGVIETTFPVIKNKVLNVLTLDRPLDNDFSIGDAVEKIDSNMNVLGSLASPRSFKIISDKDQIWHTITITVSMTHSSGSDPSLFGNLTELPNGVIFRGFNGTTGRYRTLTNWKNNSKIGLDFGKVDFEPKVGGGDFGTFASTSIKFRSGAIPKINSANGDFLEILIQDDLTGLITFNVKMQGHIEGV